MENYRVLSLEVAGDLSLRLRFDDGSTRIVDFSQLPPRGGVFKRFLESEYFRSVQIGPEGRSLEWPDHVDMCADALWLDGKPEAGP